MSGIDVRNLGKETLGTGTFPANPRADFRLYMAPEVHRGTWEHAKKDTTIEICGVLVGRWERDNNGPYAIATNFIRCENASSKFAEVTFTHESWAQINHEMDTRFEDERIIGWYHSHPDFGIFLSDRDCFIQEHFFSGAGQVAYVIDPVRELEGVFAWRDGRPTPLTHYWVGDTVRTVDASRTAGGNKQRQSQREPIADAIPIATSHRQNSSDLVMMMLSWLALFLLGYLVAGLRSSWEHNMIVEGAVNHYGYNKLLKFGLEENLDRVRTNLRTLTEALRSMPDSTADLSEEEAKTVADQRAQIAKHLAACELALARIENRYGMSDVERATLFNWMQRQNAAPAKPGDAESDSASKAKPEETDVNAKTPATEPNSSVEVADRSSTGIDTSPSNGESSD